MSSVGPKDSVRMPEMGGQNVKNISRVPILAPEKKIT
jgi:hypothetical protein